jgi:hypothetical protein
MPGANVQVAYNPTQNPAWVFTPDSATVNASGNIVFTSAPGSQWVFTGCNIKNGGSTFGTPTINPHGNQMTVSDSCPPANGYQAFQYTVTVKPTSSIAVTSPDPEIVNDPVMPEPVPAPRPPKPKA